MSDSVGPSFGPTFAEYNPPRAMLTDDGVPFATTGIHGLSQLNVWWMRSEMQHQRIRPASRQATGVHERMHRTMKRRAYCPPCAPCADQQRTFNVLRTEFNDGRPHETLGDRTSVCGIAPHAASTRARSHSKNIRSTFS